MSNQWHYDGARNRPASLFAEMALSSCSSYVVALLAVAVYADLVLKPDSTGDQGSGFGAQGSGNGPQLQVSNRNVTLTLQNYLSI